ncbi:DUF1738 domain-containing protein [Escherichia coli]|nr:DUF1738 domain-containing protein [Escherichia coli]
MAEQKQPYHERVAEEVIKALQEGTAPWIKPWEPGQQPDRPTNALTGKPYRGWNSVYLSMLKQSEDNRWCTYKQARELGAQVRKGEKGSVVQYWQFREKKLLKDDQGKPILDEKGEKQYRNVELERPKVFYSVVFHASQIDGMPPLPPRKERPEWERHADAEKLLESSGASIHHDQNDRAFYRPSTDQIHLPERGQFPTPDNYYATALHELGHWTGHPSRLDRDLAHPFGSEGYAKEELRAELASYMLGTELGIGHDPGQHTAYIGSWIKALKEEPQELFRASRDAQQIMDYVQGLVQEQEQEQEKVQTQQQTVSRSQAQATESNAMETPKQEAAQPQQLAQEKTWLNVPYKEKNEAKQHGARWDKGAKSWYAPEGTNLAPLSKWLPENNEIRQEPPQDPRAEFAEALKDAGLKVEGLPQMDGKLHRVPVEGDEKGKNSGAYKGYLDGHPAGFIQNFKSGYKGNWKATGQRLNPAEIAKLEREAEAKRQAREREREAGYNAKSQAITQELTNLPDAPADHPYLKGKGLDGAGHAFGAKQDDKGNLVIPIEDKEGKVWSVQRIGPNGFKGYEKDAKVSGCYQVIGGKDALAAQDAHEPLLISTGFGTSASIHMATGRPVVVAFQDNNLQDVAQEFKQMFPERTIAVLGDDDRHLPERTPPLPNSGRVKTNEAAKAVGGRAVFPQFTAQEKGREFTDFSDLHRVRGLAAVQRQVEQGLAQARTTVNARDQREQVMDKKQEREKEREEQKRSKSRGEARSLGL